MHAVPDDRRTGGRPADGSPDHRGFRFDSFCKPVNEVHIIPERGRGEETHVVFFRNLHDSDRVVERIRKGFVEKDRLSEAGALFKIFKMLCGIIDLDHDRIAVCDGGIEILRHHDADTFKISLALVKSLFILERGLETETSCCDQIVNLILFRNRRILHEFRELHRMTGVKPDDRDLDFIFHHINPFVCFDTVGEFFFPLTKIQQKRKKQMFFLINPCLF